MWKSGHRRNEGEEEEVKNVMRKVEKLYEEEGRGAFRREVERCLGGYDLEKMEEVEDMSKVFSEVLHVRHCVEVRGRGKGVKDTAWCNEEVKKQLRRRKRHTKTV